MNQKPEQEQYYELSYYTISHPSPLFIHQHIVDAYTAQYADEKTKEWPVFDKPEQRGEVIVSDVLVAPPGRERNEAIRKWCASVWEAYRENHIEIIDLVRKELEYGKKHPIA